MNCGRYSVQLATAFLCVGLTGCNWFKSKEEAPAATAAKLVVIDVNDKDIADKAHIKGALNVALGDIETQAVNWNKSDKYVVYCSNYDCTASEDVVTKLKGLGFNAVAYKGGIAEWLSKGYSAEGTAVEEIKAMIPLGSVKESEISAEQLKADMEAAIVVPVAAEAPVQPAAPVETTPEAK